jgi:hypothetical protein
MSDRIVVKYRDGRADREFKHKGRAGGSWTISLAFQGNVAVVTDEWQNKVCIPLDLIEEVREEPLHY